MMQFLAGGALVMGVLLFTAVSFVFIAALGRIIRGK